MKFCTRFNIMFVVLGVVWLGGVIGVAVYTGITHSGSAPTAPVISRLMNGKSDPTSVPLLMDRSAACLGPAEPNITRHDIWKDCFIPLVDKNPKDGYITQNEVQTFLSDHLRFYERWVAPSAATITHDCDTELKGPPKVPLNGRVNWAKFHATINPGCMGTASNICNVYGVCLRELAKK